MRILITGGSGFIGQALTRALIQRGDTVVILSRTPDRVPGREGVQAVATLEAVAGPVDGVVNLAGAPIVDKRWTESRKLVLRASRIDLTRQLVAWMKSRARPPKVLVSGSAIGYYGSHKDEVLHEGSATMPGFAHQLCRDWEQAALAMESEATRVCLIRTGVVLGPGGGALARMLPAFRLGLGGPIGTGQQWMSWIHLDDEVGAILYLLDNPSLRGPFNLTSPEPVTNEIFSQALGRVLARPVWFRVPAAMMKLLLGESSELLVEGQRVIPANLNSAGYAFKYRSLETALRTIVALEGKVSS